MPEAISLKFGMWSTEVGGNVHSKICLVSSRQHRATEVRKLPFLSSCQYTHGVARRLLGPHGTLPCVLIKAEPNSIGKLITGLVNSSIFPDLWKLAVVTPIQKTKVSSELTNFRPILKF